MGENRDEYASEQLVALLSDLPPLAAEALVRGAAEAREGQLVPIPSGIWRQTSTSDSNDATQPYRLIGTDDDCEWEGAILGLHVSGYRRVQIRSDFILDNWPEHTFEIEPPPTRDVVAVAELRRVIEKIDALTPSDLAPLTQREMVHFATRLMPGARRDRVRELYKDLRSPLKSGSQDLRSPLKPGPRRRRDPDRELRLKELGEKLIAAQLHN